MKFAILTAALVYSAVLMSQDNNSENTRDNIRYLIDTREATITGFGGTTYQIGTARHKLHVYSGGMGAVLLNYKYFLGGYGLGSLLNIPHNNIYNADGTLIYSNPNASINMGGLLFGYVYNHHNPIHLTGSLRIGYGILNLFSMNRENNSLRPLHSDAISMIEPEITLEINLLRWMKISFGTSYRYVFNIGNKEYFDINRKPVRYFNNSDFNTPCANINLLFGVFGPRKTT